MTNSNFAGCSTGRSAGLAPLRIFARSRTTQGRQMLARLLRPRWDLDPRLWAGGNRRIVGPSTGTVIPVRLGRLLRFRPNTLDGVHSVLLLREEGFAELLHPLELTVHPLEDLGRANQSFDAIGPFVVFE